MGSDAGCLLVIGTCVRSSYIVLYCSCFHTEGRGYDMSSLVSPRVPEPRSWDRSGGSDSTCERERVRRPVDGHHLRLRLSIFDCQSMSEPTRASDIPHLPQIPSHSITIHPLHSLSIRNPLHPLPPPRRRPYNIINPQQHLRRLTRTRHHRPLQLKTLHNPPLPHIRDPAPGRHQIQA